MTASLNRTPEQRRKYERDRKNAYRNRLRAEQGVPTRGSAKVPVPKALAVPVSPVGPVTAAVLQESKRLPGIEARQVELAIAVAMAGVLDDPLAAQKPAAASRLAEIMRDLRKGEGKGESKLGQLRALRSA